ncbi:unnamed protein product [Amoebophrya sp. A25]|nr:unnamed protein product [Amoebophrya sp. A25]|eukprot:GSA25T00012161001.1
MKATARTGASVAPKSQEDRAKSGADAKTAAPGSKTPAAAHRSKSAAATSSTANKAPGIIKKAPVVIGKPPPSASTINNPVSTTTNTTSSRAPATVATSIHSGTGARGPERVVGDGNKSAGGDVQHDAEVAASSRASSSTSTAASLRETDMVASASRMHQQVESASRTLHDNMLVEDEGPTSGIRARARGSRPHNTPENELEEEDPTRQGYLSGSGDESFTDLIRTSVAQYYGEGGSRMAVEEEDDFLENKNLENEIAARGGSSSGEEGSPINRSPSRDSAAMRDWQGRLSKLDIVAVVYFFLLYLAFAAICSYVGSSASEVHLPVSAEDVTHQGHYLMRGEITTAAGTTSAEEGAENVDAQLQVTSTSSTALEDISDRNTRFGGPDFNVDVEDHSDSRRTTSISIAAPTRIPFRKLYDAKKAHIFHLVLETLFRAGGFFLVFAAELRTKLRLPPPMVGSHEYRCKMYMGRMVYLTKHGNAFVAYHYMLGMIRAATEIALLTERGEGGAAGSVKTTSSPDGPMFSSGRVGGQEQDSPLYGSYEDMASSAQRFVLEVARTIFSSRPSLDLTCSTTSTSGSTPSTCSSSSSTLQEWQALLATITGNCALIVAVLGSQVSILWAVLVMPSAQMKKSNEWLWRVHRVDGFAIDVMGHVPGLPLAVCDILMQRALVFPQLGYNAWRRAEGLSWIILFFLAYYYSVVFWNQRKTGVFPYEIMSQIHRTPFVRLRCLRWLGLTAFCLAGCLSLQFSYIALAGRTGVPTSWLKAAAMSIIHSIDSVNWLDHLQ